MNTYVVVVTQVVGAKTKDNNYGVLVVIRSAFG